MSRICGQAKGQHSPGFGGNLCRYARRPGILPACVLSSFAEQ
jgi:hypothetical protein